MINSKHETYPAALEYFKESLVLRMLVTISNSEMGLGTCIIPTLRMEGKDKADFVEAATWNSDHIREKGLDESSTDDLLRYLGLTKVITKPFHASVLSSASSPYGAAVEGILITHGSPKEIIESNNIPKDGELIIFLNGLAQAYPHLNFKRGFNQAKSRTLSELYQLITS
jgi:hypothetical protein